MIKMPFLRLRAEMGKLRMALDKASKEYDQEKELYAGMEEELSRFDFTLSSTVELFTVQDERKARTLAKWLGGLLGLYNPVKVKQIEAKEDSTREALKTALVHLSAMDLHEKEEKLIGEVIDKLEDTRRLIFRGSRARQAKDGYPTLCPFLLCPRSLCPGHFVPWSLCPWLLCPPSLCPLVTLSPGHFVPRSLCPPVTLSPVTLSPGHFVPWSLCPRSLCPQSLCPLSLCPLYSIFGMT
jgi:hypothetical protein